MAFEDNVKAQVVDIRNDYPNPEDNFFIDTNVWFWFTSSYLSLGGGYQLRDYPNYISKILGKKSKIYRCELILAELSHVVEKSLHEIYEYKTGLNIPLKQYRYNCPGERENFIDEIKMSWDSIAEISETFEVTISNSTSKSVLDGFNNYFLDGYDLIYLTEIREYLENPLILTDDRDFATFHGITVFTANKTVISAAKEKGLLISRRN